MHRVLAHHSACNGFINLQFVTQVRLNAKYDDICTFPGNKSRMIDPQPQHHPYEPIIIVNSNGRHAIWPPPEQPYGIAKRGQIGLKLAIDDSHPSLSNRRKKHLSGEDICDSLYLI